MLNLFYHKLLLFPTKEYALSIVSNLFSRFNFFCCCHGNWNCFFNYHHFDLSRWIRCIYKDKRHRLISMSFFVAFYFFHFLLKVFKSFDFCFILLSPHNLPENQQVSHHQPALCGWLCHTGTLQH